MAIESPLFQSAMELLGHSFSHYNGKKELDRKLVILHLANAVELILKDLVLDCGQSIYKNSKETITINGCVSVLKTNGTEIPHFNKIELLIDERNALQHRFGSPNELTSIFYMKIAQDFFKEVLRVHYGENYDDIIKQFADEKELAEYEISDPKNDQELENLRNLGRIHPLGALLAAWSYLENIFAQFARDIGLKETETRRFGSLMSRRFFSRIEIEVPDELWKQFGEMRVVKSRVTHGSEEPSQEQVNRTIELVEAFEKFISNINCDEVREKLSEKQKSEEVGAQNSLAKLFDVHIQNLDKYEFDINEDKINENIIKILMNKDINKNE